ncbi:microsomal signal peptidase 12 kDa subunit-domain-containing protein [Gamsiella multidivaricata]|uniref:microsomal signal peptidase 12 kDa subunit-domain-containing protein n=1 Tax=Gamsiella multidivaricata TaxID=101098 RepID=UPI002220B779|nr:microsomal signal peptidase 12 kDa subunit-domain-containing protein [Gamsiella multidivaricata]KAI7828056.1 microsomal signal peptidase 12 kDa subunit-domain-containing protein [Gamsiella multidivaricata]
MLEYHIDFQGQSLAEQITQVVISAFGVLGFLVGIVLQDIRLTLYIFAAGVVLAGLLIIPAWPYLNKDPTKWLPSRAKAAATALKQRQEASSTDNKGKST